jgi:hypothetical protein
MLQDTVAFVRRGRCSFVQKVLNMQNAGAKAVVVGNNQGKQELTGMVGDGNEDRVLTIPAAMITKEDADALLWWVGRRAVVATLAHKAEEEAEELPLGLFGGLREGPGPWMQGAVPWGMGSEQKQKQQLGGQGCLGAGKSATVGKQRRGQQQQQQQQEGRVQVEVVGKKAIVLGRGVKWGKQGAAKAARTLEELNGAAGVQENSSSSRDGAERRYGGREEDGKGSSTAGVPAVTQLSSKERNFERSAMQQQREHEHDGQALLEKEGELEQEHWDGQGGEEGEGMQLDTELAASLPDLWRAVQQELLERLREQNSHVSPTAQEKSAADMVAGLKVSELQVDLFVPAQSQAWLQEHVLKKGVTAAEVHQTLVTDPQVLKVLTRGAQDMRKMSDNAGQATKHVRKGQRRKDGEH